MTKEKHQPVIYLTLLRSSMQRIDALHEQDLNGTKEEIRRRSNELKYHYFAFSQILYPIYSPQTKAGNKKTTKEGKDVRNLEDDDPRKLIWIAANDWKHELDVDVKEFRWLELDDDEEGKAKFAPLKFGMKSELLRDLWSKNKKGFLFDIHPIFQDCFKLVEEDVASWEEHCGN